MTREEALNILYNASVYHPDYLDAFNMAIKALEQEPCEDAVSRQAVLKTLDDIDNVLDEDRTVENYKELLKECYEVLPPVNPQKKIGHWTRYGILPKCSECGKDSIGEHNYCPNCGAKMVELQESEVKE